MTDDNSDLFVPANQCRICGEYVYNTVSHIKYRHSEDAVQEYRASIKPENETELKERYEHYLREIHNLAYGNNAFELIQELQKCRVELVTYGWVQKTTWERIAK